MLPMCKVDHPEGAFHAKLYLCLRATLMISRAWSCCNLFVFFTAAFKHAVAWSTIPMAPWFRLTQTPRRSCGLWGSFWPYKEPSSLAGFPVGGFWFLSLWFTLSLFLSLSLCFLSAGSSPAPPFCTLLLQNEVKQFYCNNTHSQSQYLWPSRQLW